MNKLKIAKEQAAEAQILAEDLIKITDRLRSHAKRYEVAGLFGFLTTALEVPDENEPDGFRLINIDTDRDIYLDYLGFTAGQVLDIEFILSKVLNYLEATNGSFDAPNFLYNAIGLSRANRL